MHLTREAINSWIVRIPSADTRIHLIRLTKGESMPAYSDFPESGTGVLTGPAIVELVVWRDGGWSAREMRYETPESIALAASLGQREQTYLWQSQTLPVPPERRQ